MTVTRFAPSPNGSLHMGHAYSAIVAHDLAMAGGGRFLLRIEDIDGARSRPELSDEFRRDLEWLGLEWDEVPAQSTRLESYQAAAERLLEMDLLYPCTCTRAQIEALEPRVDPHGEAYPGSCKGSAHDLTGAAAMRLDLDAAMALAGDLQWQDDATGMQRLNPREFGDVVLVRKDAPASYHLAATLDDAADGVTLVTRGADLFAMTNIHRLLQHLLSLPVPRWHHHTLLLDKSGEKLAKRRNSPSLSDRREGGENGKALAQSLRMGQMPCGITLSPFPHGGT